MWKTFVGWIAAFLGMTRELEEHRLAIKQLEERIRDNDETLKLLAQEMRHIREMEALERDKQLLKVEREITRLKELPGPKRKK